MLRKEQTWNTNFTRFLLAHQLLNELTQPNSAGALMPSRLGPHHLAEGCEFVFTRALMNCGLCGLNESELLRIKATLEDGASPSPHFGRCFNKRAVDGHRGSSSLTRQNQLREETRLRECSSSIRNMQFCATAPGFQPSPKRLIVQQPKDKGSSPSALWEQCVEVWVVMQITNCTGHRGKREGNGSLSARHAEGGEGRTVVSLPPFALSLPSLSPSFSLSLP